MAVSAVVPGAMAAALIGGGGAAAVPPQLLLLLLLLVMWSTSVQKADFGPSTFGTRYCSGSRACRRSIVHREVPQGFGGDCCSYAFSL